MKGKIATILIGVVVFLSIVMFVFSGETGIQGRIYGVGDVSGYPGKYPLPEYSVIVLSQNDFPPWLKEIETEARGDERIFTHRHLTNTVISVSQNDDGYYSQPLNEGEHVICFVREGVGGEDQLFILERCA